MTDHLPEVEPESLRVQLGIANERGRWYTAETWQLPFTYVGVTAIGVSQVVDKGVPVLTIALALSAIAGLLTAWHLWSIRDNVRRAVEIIRKLEPLLGLDVTAQFRRGLRPLDYLVYMVTGAYFLGLVFLLCKESF